MNTALIILGILVLVVIIFVIYRFIKVNRQSRKLNEKRFDRVRELYEKLESANPVTESDVLPFAKNRITREITHQLLHDHNQLTLFPAAYNTLVAGAESNLATWLEFPTELDAIPDEIEHVKRVTIDFDGHQNFVHYEVFKYKMYEPHWAAADGWILGVVGPYFDDSQPYDFPHSTFSRVSSTIDKVTPEEEANWVHENISKKKK